MTWGVIVFGKIKGEFPNCFVTTGHKNSFRVFIYFSLFIFPVIGTNVPIPE
jgi:hypothetical protein